VKDERAPENPAGELELSDDELADIGGGLTCGQGSCDSYDNASCTKTKVHE
jgi:hypothetical protein